MFHVKHFNCQNVSRETSTVVEKFRYFKVKILLKFLFKLLTNAYFYGFFLEKPLTNKRICCQIKKKSLFNFRISLFKLPHFHIYFHIHFYISLFFSIFLLFFPVFSLFNFHISTFNFHIHFHISTFTSMFTSTFVSTFPY